MDLPVWADVALRFGAAFALIGIVILIHWLGRDGLYDQHDGTVGLLDIVYFTMISITTTGFGDITPVSNNARLIEAVIVTPIRLAVIFIFIGTAYRFLIKHSWETWRMARIQERLSGHIVVLGFGVSGSQAVQELIDRGTAPHGIVVLDPSPGRLAIAERMGCNVMEGDASRDDVLLAVRIADARAVLVSAGRDDTSILIVLTVRHLAPDVPITVVVRAQDNELLARQAGANNVINPVHFTGLLLAGSAEGQHISEYLADLASVSGRVQLVERPVARMKSAVRSISSPLAGVACASIAANGRSASGRKARNGSNRAIPSWRSSAAPEPLSRQPEHRAHRQIGGQPRAGFGQPGAPPHILAAQRQDQRGHDEPQREAAGHHPVEPWLPIQRRVPDPREVVSQHDRRDQSDGNRRDHGFPVEIAARRAQPAGARHQHDKHQPAQHARDEHRHPVHRSHEHSFYRYRARQ